MPMHLRGFVPCSFEERRFGSSDGSMSPPCSFYSLRRILCTVSSQIKRVHRSSSLPCRHRIGAMHAVIGEMILYLYISYTYGVQKWGQKKCKIKAHCNPSFVHYFTPSSSSSAKVIHSTLQRVRSLTHFCTVLTLHTPGVLLIWHPIYDNLKWRRSAESKECNVMVSLRNNDQYTSCI